MTLFNVAAAVVTLIEAPTEEAAKNRMRAMIQSAGLDVYEGSVDSSKGIDAFESEREHRFSVGQPVEIMGDNGWLQGVVVEVYDSGAVRVAYQHDSPNGPFHMSARPPHVREV